MKKAAAGFIAGVLFATTATAYADTIESVVGMAVEGTLPLIINGKQADKDVIVVDGTSYLPVRAAGEMFGYSVDFINREVVLEKDGGGTTPQDSSNSEEEEEDSSATTGQEEEEEEPAPKSGVIYSYKTSLFPLSSAKGKLLVRDGEQYVSVLVFGSYLSNNGVIATVALPGRASVDIPLNNSNPNNGFSENGSIYVSLSALQLKAVLNGGTSVLLLSN